MPKATIEIENNSSVLASQPVSGSAMLDTDGELLSLELDQIILDPVTDVRTGPVGRDEEARIDSLARTMFDQGQLQPVVVRRNGKPGKFLLIAGRRRYAAAKLIEAKSKAPFLLKAMVVVKDDNEAYSAAIQENLQRRQFSPIELANQITEIRSRMGYNGDDWTKHVAEFLHVSRATVSQHAKLLNLPAKIQSKVHSGLLSAQSAFELASVEEAQQEAVLAKAEDLAEQEAASKPAKAAKPGKNGTVKAEPEAPVKPAKVEHKHVLAASRDAESTTKPRTRTEIVAFFSQIIESADSYSDPIYKFCDTFVNKWATGSVSDRSLLNRLNDINELCEDKSAKGKPAAKKAAK